MDCQSEKGYCVNCAVRTVDQENGLLIGIKLILLIVVLLHSQGHGCVFETATSTSMTKFKSYLIGLSNEVSFISLSFVVPE